MSDNLIDAHPPAKSKVHLHCALFHSILWLHLKGYLFFLFHHSLYYARRLLSNPYYDDEQTEAEGIVGVIAEEDTLT